MKLRSSSNRHQHFQFLTMRSRQRTTSKQKVGLACSQRITLQSRQASIIFSALSSKEFVGLYNFDLWRSRWDSDLIVFLEPDCFNILFGLISFVLFQQFNEVISYHIKRKWWDSFKCQFNELIILNIWSIRHQ